MRNRQSQGHRILDSQFLTEVEHQSSGVEHQFHSESNITDSQWSLIEHQGRRFHQIDFNPAIQVSLIADFLKFIWLFQSCVV